MHTLTAMRATLRGCTDNQVWGISLLIALGVCSAAGSKEKGGGNGARQHRCTVGK